MKICLRVLCGNDPGGWINPQLFAGLYSNLGAFQQRGHIVALGLLAGLSPVAYARNRAAMDALETGADWLMMVDNDQILPDNMTPLLEEADCDQQINIVSVATWMMRRGPNPALMVNNMPVEDVESGLRIEQTAWMKWQRTWAKRILAPEKGFQEISVGGAGVMLIRRRVLETCRAPWFHTPIDTATGEAQGGEDDYFCDRAKDAGFKIHAHRGYTCGHLKTVDLRLFQ